MPVILELEMDKRTGEIRTLRVDDGERHLPEEEHDALAREIADLLVPGAAIVREERLSTADLLPEAAIDAQRAREILGGGRR